MNLSIRIHKWLILSALVAGAAQAEDLPGASVPVDQPQIVGPVADGSAPLPSPPLPKLEIQPEDVLQTRQRELGGRKIIVQQVVPMELPAPQLMAEGALLSSQVTDMSGEITETDSETAFVFIAATVYHFPDRAPKTRVRISTPEHPGEIVCWSSANWNWLSGFGSFKGADGRHYVLMSSIANDEDLNRDEVTLHIPTLPAGKASFVTVEGNGSLEAIAPLQALHDLYNSDGVRLKAAYEGRELARQQKEAELSADPPKPKDIVIRYWRVNSASKENQPAISR